MYNTKKKTTLTGKRCMTVQMTEKKILLVLQLVQVIVFVHPKTGRDDAQLFLCSIQTHKHQEGAHSMLNHPQQPPHFCSTKHRL